MRYVATESRTTHDRLMQECTARHARFGDLREPLTVVASGYRVVVTGDEVSWSREEQWRYPADFLRDYAIRTFGLEWWKQQRAQPREQWHPVVDWEDRIFALRRAAAESGYKADVELTATGSMLAFLRLARDLHAIKDNAHFQLKVLDRLRHPDQFAGARFELTVAAACLAAGRKIGYPEDRNDGTKPADLSAEAQGGAGALLIEAKTRNRPGILGFKGSRVMGESLGVHTLLNKAFRKDTLGRPFLVFVDLNVREKDTSALARLESKLLTAFNASQKDHPNGYPASAVLFYNDCTPHHLEAEFDSRRQAMSAWAYACRPNNPAVPLRDYDTLIPRIHIGLIQRARIPLTWRQ